MEVKVEPVEPVEAVETVNESEETVDEPDSIDELLAEEEGETQHLVIVNVGDINVEDINMEEDPLDLTVDVIPNARVVLVSEEDGRTSTDSDERNFTETMQSQAASPVRTPHRPDQDVPPSADSGSETHQAR